MLIDIIINIKNFVFYVFDSLIYIPLSFSKKNNYDIILVRPDGIGDFIVWLDSAKEYRKIYPDREITLIGNAIWTETAKNHPYFDKIITVRTKQFKNDFHYRFKTLKQIGSIKANLVINPIFSRQNYFRSAESIVRFIDSAEKIGYESENSKIWNARLSSRWYTKLIPASKEPKMELIRNADFIRQLGLPDFRADLPCLPGQQTPGSNGKYYVIFPGAGHSCRQWPTKNFAAISERIYKETGLKGIICGSRNEQELSDKIIRSSDAPLEDLAGKTSISELINLISGALFLVSNETSATHIAAAVKTESICILGGGHFGRFVPYKTETENNDLVPRCVNYSMPCYHCNWKCIYKNIGPNDPYPCISNISVESVWAETKNIIREKGL